MFIAIVTLLAILTAICIWFKTNVSQQTNNTASRQDNDAALQEVAATPQEFVTTPLPVRFGVGDSMMLRELRQELRRRKMAIPDDE
jgi:hypothetical protein